MGVGVQSDVLLNTGPGLCTGAVRRRNLLRGRQVG